MGSEIIELVKRSSDFELVYGLEIQERKDLGIRAGTDIRQIANADVVVDFTMPEVSLSYASATAQYKKAMVIGTTGFSPEQEQKLKEIARAIPLVKSPNMSLGVNILFKISQETARVLRSYGVEIIETHHRHKKDAPSGTALQIGKLIENSGGQKAAYQSIREGEVVGDHRVVFSGPGERLELFHHAESRRTFATGALAAAQWVVKQKPGYYTMADALGLS